MYRLVLHLVELAGVEIIVEAVGVSVVIVVVVGCAEVHLKQAIHKLLLCALQKQRILCKD